jgi:hypothetical protein
MSDAIAIANRYIALWNETNDDKRHALITSAWTPDATYIDPLMKGEGHTGISQMIGAVHQRFPAHRFTLRGKPEGHNDRVRFSWTLASSDAKTIANGTDFAIVTDDGKLKAVTGFLDQA